MTRHFSLCSKASSRLAGLLCALLLAATSGGWFWSDPVARRNEEGNRLWVEENYTEALKVYRDAQLRAPENPILYYNVGQALLQQRKFEEATAELDQAAQRSDDPELQADAIYNRGLAQFEAGQLEAAIESFVRTLEIRPDDEDAKYNIEYIRRKIAEEAQKQQDPSQQQQDKQQQQEQQQCPQGEEAQEGEQDEEQQTAQAGDAGTPTPQPQLSDEQAPPEGEATPVEMQLTPEEAARLLENLDEENILKRMRRHGPRGKKEKFW
jgi:Ca-activated chloride channel homolog